ncbi:MAG: GNAT family N-acetyltransferase [Janthinobacterium lividum]
MTPYLLKVGGSDQLTEAHLIRELTVASYTFVSAQWQAYKAQHCPPGSLPGSFSWNWGEKAAVAPSQNCRLLGLHSEGCVEGLVMVSKVPSQSRMSGLTNESVMYIEYLEGAPWNQKLYAGGAVRFEGVGTALISVAVEESYALGCDGRLGLHSLPEAVKFYEKMGFINLGFDTTEGFTYFELRG